MDPRRERPSAQRSIRFWGLPFRLAGTPQDPGTTSFFPRFMPCNRASAGFHPARSITFASVWHFLRPSCSALRLSITCFHWRRNPRRSSMSAMTLPAGSKAPKNGARNWRPNLAPKIIPPL